MRKNSVTMRGLSLYASFNKRYFPTRLLEIAFQCLAPYFTIWMSSEIVTALYENKSRREVAVMVTVALIGNLVIRILNAVFKRMADMEGEILLNNEAVFFNQKTMSLDYEKMEDPAIRMHRRKIRENANINMYGIEFMHESFLLMVQSMINLALSLVLFTEMIVAILNAGISCMGIALFLVMILSLAFSLWRKARRARAMHAENKKIGDTMLEENRLGSGYSLDGMDNRLYNQQRQMDEMEKRVGKMHLQAFAEWADRDFRLSFPITLSEKMMELCTYLIICIYCVMGAFPVGSVIKYVGFLAKMTADIGNILMWSSEMKTNEPYLKLYLDYMDIPNDMYEGSLSVEKRSDRKFDISFQNVSFRYSGANEYALKDISIDLKVGEKLAVVGMNGSGKTTFIKLLCRLYDPSEGEILLNDFNIRKYDYRQYLDLFSIVFQDYTLLSMPLGNNIASSEKWDAEKAEYLIDKIGFSERYESMPQKLDTPLFKDFDENGVIISGGEAQKLALARALYKDAPFIILDEPTAALDPIAEAEIYAKFDSIVGSRTAIYISHRLSSCRFCDKIAVFDQGRIVQVGTHDELLKDENGKYYELWHAQASYYTK